MRTGTVARCFVCFVAAMVMGCAAMEKAGTSDAPALWVIEHKDERMWLFGTIHQLPPEGVPNPFMRRGFGRLKDPVPLAPWRTRTLRSAVRSSHTMVLEVVASSERDELKALAREIGASVADTPWHASLNASDRDQVRLALDERGLPADSADDLGKLQVLLLLISLPTLEQDRLSPGVDAWMLEEGRLFGLELVGLETAASRLRLFRDEFESYDSAGRTALLMAYDDGAQKSLDTVRMAYAEWISGKLKSLEASINRVATEQPEVYQTFFSRRNHLWAEQLIEYLGDGRDTFVAVGTGHLVGPDNLIELLARHGHEARRVQ